MRLNDLFVQPVEGEDDLCAFRFDFVPQGKAIEDGKSQLVTVEQNGDLIVEGYAAVWDGDDREGENFVPEAFQHGVKTFLEGQAAFCYGHKHDKLLGRFLDLRPDGKGLRFRARVDGAIQTHPELKTYYQQIKNGSLRGMSVGGFFHRGEVEGKQKIVKCDLTEISAVPVPCHPGTSLTVVAGKALEDLSTPRNQSEEHKDTQRAEALLHAVEALHEAIKPLVQRSDDDVVAPAGSTE
jgi:HK97 family phage prohead protease